MSPISHRDVHYHKDPAALLWIIFGLLAAVATFMCILALVPKY